MRRATFSQRTSPRTASNPAGNSRGTEGASSGALASRKLKIERSPLGSTTMVEREVRMPGIDTLRLVSMPWPSSKPRNCVPTASSPKRASRPGRPPSRAMAKAPFVAVPPMVVRMPLARCFWPGVIGIGRV